MFQKITSSSTIVVASQAEFSHSLQYLHCEDKVLGHSPLAVSTSFYAYRFACRRHRRGRHVQRKCPIDLPKVSAGQSIRRQSPYDCSGVAGGSPCCHLGSAGGHGALVRVWALVCKGIPSLKSGVGHTRKT